MPPAPPRPLSAEDRPLTAAEMRAAEAAAIASGRASARALMERAGAAVVEALRAAFPALGAGRHRALLLCGPGNNGGDGLVVARLLHGLGWEVTVWLWGDPARLPPDAAANLARWQALGPVARLDGPAPPPEPPPPELVVDALFGIGQRRPLPPGAAAAVARFCGPQHAAPVVAVDIPSGLDSDTGERLGAEGEVVHADLTVTFHAPKPGLLTGAGPALAGRVVVADIGLPTPAEGPGA